MAIPLIPGVIVIPVPVPDVVIRITGGEFGKCGSGIVMEQSITIVVPQVLAGPCLQSQPSATIIAEVHALGFLDRGHVLLPLAIPHNAGLGVL